MDTTGTEHKRFFKATKKLFTYHFINHPITLEQVASLRAIA